jgi:2-methylisocitrate lyase-like PEP mutase family enzyme
MEIRMKTQAEKAAAFAALHEAPGCFIIPNPWDRGSSRLLAALGFKALTTTSAGYARSTGVADYGITREQLLAHVRDLADATDLPLAGDLENGFGHDPESCAETIRLSADAGLVGGSIEDWNGEDTYDIGLACDRIRAAAEAARSLPFKFMLVGRCENYLHGRNDLADTITRLQAYQEAGADVLYAPALSTTDDIRAVCQSVDRPVNILGGIGSLTVADLAELGVKRVSVGNFLHSAAMTGFLAAAQELKDGTFSFVAGLTSGGDLNRLLEQGAG